MSVKLGVPSKGRLMEKTFDWFGARGVTLTRTGSEREYAGAVEGIDGLELVLLSAGEIPRELAAGRIHLGVTGSDLVREKLGAWEEKVRGTRADGLRPCRPGASRCRSAWVDVDHARRSRRGGRARSARAHGFRLRIATKYHRLVRDYLREHGVADYQLVDSQGATEGTVKNETAEAIADITSTGETLRANHLKMLAGGPVHRSQATLFKSRKARLDERTTARRSPRSCADAGHRELRSCAPHAEAADEAPCILHLGSKYSDGVRRGSEPPARCAPGPAPGRNLRSRSRWSPARR